MGRTLGVTLAAVMGLSTLATTAHADPAHGGVDWMRLLVQLDGLARGKAEKRSPATEARSPDPAPNNAGNAWFGVEPKLTLVARDWASAYRLAGDRLSLVDAMRLSASTRMVLSRVRMSDLRSTRVVPFVQMGAGQWRTDPNLLPLTPRSTELAAQFGGGIEWHVLPRWQLACESTFIALYRENGGPPNVPQSRIWSAAIASRIEF